LDWLGWVDSRNGILVDDLRAITSRKFDREAIEPFDSALQPNPGYKK
jgi:hypothetical protein